MLSVLKQICFKHLLIGVFLRIFKANENLYQKKICRRFENNFQARGNI